jgi:chemotaxis protein histidine kinase CheA
MSDALVEEFLAETNDKYYPQIMEGIGLLEAGQVQEGIEVLARPLHTIKGVTGFMAGFEPASQYTHKVEDFLKKIQAGGVAASPENVELLSLAVNMVFGVIEQIHEQGKPDEAETSEILEQIRRASGAEGKAAAASAECLSASRREGCLVLRVAAERLHLAPEREALTKALAGAARDEPVLLDLSAVRTVGSAVFEAVVAASHGLSLAVTGMGPAVKEVFYSWGFDRFLPLADSVEAFLSGRRPASGAADA